MADTVLNPVRGGGVQLWTRQTRFLFSHDISAVGIVKQQPGFVITDCGDCHKDNKLKRVIEILGKASGRWEALRDQKRSF